VVRLRYAKLGRVVALSHLETVHTLLRAVRRAGLPVAFSQGYHPKPRVSFGPALPVGVESLCEHLDLELIGPAHPADVARRLAPELPEGLEIREARVVDPREPSVIEAQRAVHYRVDLRAAGLTDDDIARRIASFLGADRAVVTRAPPPKNRRAGRRKVAAAPGKEIDLKGLVTHLASEGGGSVAFSLRADPSGSAKPAEVLGAIFGDGSPPRGVKLLKEGVSFARTGEGRPDGQPRAPRYLDA
jgi:radical SAM-linked protein